MAKLNVLLVVLFLAALLPSSAPAEPVPDVIGLYAFVDDLGAHGTALYLDPTVRFKPVTLHLCLLNLSAGGAHGFECRIERVLNDGPDLAYVSFDLSRGINAADTDAGEFFVGILLPAYPDPQGVLEVATLNALTLSPATDVDFFIRPFEPASLPGGLPCYVAPIPSDVRQLNVSSGDVKRPVFRIYGTVPAPTTDATWGGVKGLFK